jgi:hypothetical protein
LSLGHVPSRGERLPNYTLHPTAGVGHLPAVRTTLARRG